MKNLRLVFVFLFLSFIGANKVLCCGVLSSDDSEFTPVVTEISRLARSLHTASAIIIYKLLPPPTWTTQYRHAEGCYGFVNGIGLYPGFLKFMNGDLKIGFLFFEHRSWEIIPKLIQLLIYKCKFSKAMCELSFCVGMGLIFPLSLSILSIKYKFLRMNMFSILEVLGYLVRVFMNSADTILYSSPFLFSLDSDYQAKLCCNLFWALIIFVFPRVSIDVSWFLTKNKTQ